jgi:hypothetical protein
MKKCNKFALLVSLLLVNFSAFSLPLVAENRGVNITVGSIGGALDGAALRAVRRVVGFSVASGVVDTFVVYSPKVGGPIPIEGGISACAEAGFTADKQKFNSFINELRSIKPKPGTVYELQPVANCATEQQVFCTLDVQSCPDGSFVSRVPPSCAFSPCPAPLK